MRLPLQWGCTEILKTACKLQYGNTVMKKYYILLMYGYAITQIQRNKMHELPEKNIFSVQLQITIFTIDGFCITP